MFVDNVKLLVKAGDGGNGCVAFHREKYVSHGGPDGGDGGKGGNVIVRVDEGETTLLFYKYRHKFIAENGDDGKNSKFHGKNGENLIMLVPPGTVIKDAKSGLVIHDMSDGEDFLLCKGGNGGWGNTHFATPTRQIPRFAKGGQKGQEKEVIFELKMLADVGLVGLPNVGKSSILSRVSAARPKIANYHFTTLSPNLGVVNTKGTKGFVIADIPGLIEGASDGAGLGHAFLRHVDRCRLLIHVVDISGLEGRDPVEDIKLINEELDKYSIDLSGRPQIIAANKSDCLDPELVDVEAFESFVKENGWELMYVSAATGKNLDELMQRAQIILDDLPPMITYDAEYIHEEIVDPTAHDIEIHNVNGVYVVEGEWLENLMNNVNFSDRESLMYFQRVLKNSGVIDALTAKGCKDGDTVDIYGFEFDFVQ